MKLAYFFKKSIYAKIMVVFLASIVLLCMFYIFMYNTSMQSLKNERIQAIKQSEQSQIEYIERDVARIKDTLQLSYLNPDWYNVAFHKGRINDYTFLQTVLRAKERLQSIKNLSPMVDDVYAFFPKWERTISAGQGLVEFDDKDFGSLKMDKDAAGAQLVYYKNVIYLTTAYDFETPDILSLAARLNISELYGSYKNFESYDQISSSYLLNSKNWSIILKILDNEHLAFPENITENMTDDSGVISFRNQNKEYLCIYHKSPYLGLTLVDIIADGSLIKPFYFQTRLIIGFTVAMFFIVVIIMYVNYRVIAKPIKSMVHAFGTLEKGDFSVRLTARSQDELGVLSSSFDKMVNNLSQLIGEVYEKELLVERSNLKQLQSQINPHFLYNSFYALNNMIKIEDNDNASAFCSFLGKYFQYITRNGQDTVALKSEYDHACTYVKLMAMRNADKICFEYGDLPEEWVEYKVPRLILQPVVENAIEHGMKTKNERFMLKISFGCKDDTLDIIIDDNGTGFTGEQIEDMNRKFAAPDASSEVTGLVNINRRLQIMFGADCGISAVQSDMGGARIVLRLRKREGEAGL